MQVTLKKDPSEEKSASEIGKNMNPDAGMTQEWVD